MHANIDLQMGYFARVSGESIVKVVGRSDGL